MGVTIYIRGAQPKNLTHFYTPFLLSLQREQIMKVPTKVYLDRPLMPYSIPHIFTRDASAQLT